MRLLTIGPRHFTLEFRTATLLLFVAYLPSVLYIGHLDVRIPVPALGVELALPLFSTGADHHNASAAAHGDHCHGTSDCSSAPQAPGASVQHLRKDVVAFVAGGMTYAVPLVERTPRPGWTPAPLPPPPRPSALSL